MALFDTIKSKSKTLAASLRGGAAVFSDKKAREEAKAKEPEEKREASAEGLSALFG